MLKIKLLKNFLLQIHTVPHKTKHCSTSLNKPNIYSWPDLCHVIIKNDQKCARKYDNSCISKANKISIFSTPAKLNATISKTSSECLKLTIQSLRLENKKVKKKSNAFSAGSPKIIS